MRTVLALMVIPRSALDIHGVEKLLLHVALGHGPGQLDQPVGERGFPVVDMGDDGEVADAGEVGHARPARDGLQGEIARVRGRGKGLRGRACPCWDASSSRAARLNASSRRAGRRTARVAKLQSLLDGDDLQARDGREALHLVASGGGGFGHHVPVGGIEGLRKTLIAAPSHAVISSSHVE